MSAAERGGIICISKISVLVRNSGKACKTVADEVSSGRGFHKFSQFIPSHRLGLRDCLQLVQPMDRLACIAETERLLRV